MATLDFTGDRVDLDVHVGTEATFTADIQDGAGVSIDKTNREYSAEVKAGLGGTGAVVLALTVTNPGGTGELIITGSFDSVAAGVYVWDLWETTLDQRIIGGLVTVADRVTTSP